MFVKFYQLLFGAPRNPFSMETRQHIALIALLAWVGLGADGLSSSCYGPEEAFLALGAHTHLSLYLAVATALTVFIISLGYNQVIELFPSGGGGYKVATQLISPHAGLVSGAALIVDYVLTITISVASGVDALFSLLPLEWQQYKVTTEFAAIALLMGLNLRGIRESIKVLLPIFLGFVITHVVLIVYGISSHKSEIPQLIATTLNETQDLSKEMGWLFVASLFLRAFSLGGGTYTGLEAVSNNVNKLAEPRVTTGKWTMFYMAVSLSFMAGGIILLYLLWQVTPIVGQTLNAVTFKAILGDIPYNQEILTLVLALEAGLLYVAANTGFLAGPAVLANMAVDGWVPSRFRHLSTRLVTQNGVILYGVAAFVILQLTQGRVSMLVVLYSINVFLTFAMSLLGLCIYWWKHRSVVSHWYRRLILSTLGFIISSGILLITLYEKFTYGGWMTVLITSTVIAVCLIIKRHYTFVTQQLTALDTEFAAVSSGKVTVVPRLDAFQPTAVFMINSRGTGMHTLLWVLRMFPNHFKNFVFLSAGVVDVESFGGKNALEALQRNVGEVLRYFVEYCHRHGLAATSYCDYGTEPVIQITTLAEKINKEFPNCIFFASQLIFEKDNWFTRLLHNETAIAMQRRLHLRGMQLVILPMKL